MTVEGPEHDTVLLTEFDSREKGLIHRRNYKVLDKALKVWYYDLNKKLFNSKLPRNLPVKVMSTKKFWGLFWYNPETLKPIRIEVNADCWDPIKVLVHEMVHCWQRHVKHDESPIQHNKIFSDKLRSCYKRMNMPPPTRWELSNK